MGKIKLNLVSGASVEKPLISAFKANNNSYIVLDNEINGSMGLPIILVCKYDQDKLIKINDQGEWQLVKEYLKNIIAGNSVEYFSVGVELAADDIYYTQLTLPVPSFDALKKAYKVEDVASSETPVMDMNPVAPEEINPVPPVSVETPIPTPEVAPVNPVMPEAVINPSAPVIDINIPNPPSAPVEPTPVVENVIPTAEPQVESTTSITPVIPEAPVQSDVTPVVEPVMPEPEITPTPVIDAEVTPVSTPDSIFKEQKEAFMQACENMFDALVQKFEKELENRK